jgi:hypothetical protein
MENPKMMPLHIELMMHYHCSASPFARRTAPAVVAFTQQLLKAGLIVATVYGYKTTEGGRMLPSDFTGGK